MPETDVTLSADDQAAAAFDRLLTAESTSAIVEPEPEPTPIPEPEPEPAVEKTPKVAASTGEPDKRTREGKKRSIQAEIDSETARKYAAKQEADAEEARLTTLRAESARLAQAQRTPPPTPQAAQAPAEPPQAAWKRYMGMPDAPKPDQFTGENAWQEYQFAVSDFIADKRGQEREYAQRVTAQRKPFEDRVAAEIATDPTFGERLNQTPIDTRIVPWLHQHPRGPEVMVYLANNPQVAQHLTLLNPIDQIGQIGEIVGSLKSRSTAAQSGPASRPAISQAKPLIKPVSAAPQASDDDEEPDESELSAEEFIRRRNKAENIPIPSRRR